MEILKCEEKTRRLRILPMVFRLDISLKFARSDFGKPGFFSRGGISASLNLDGKVACVKERFVKCEMRMEKAHDFWNDVWMESSGDDLFDID